MTRLYCTNCKCEFEDIELSSVCVDQGGRHASREYDDQCPNCGANQEYHEKVELCAYCKDEYPVKGEKYCAPCMVDHAESVMEDR